MNDDKETADSSADSDEDIYVLEDTGESLEQFDIEEAVEAVQSHEGRASASFTDSADLERLQTENRKLQDQAIRTLADFDNFRKRSEREKQDYFRYALADFARNLLPVLDNFERAIAAPGDGGADFRTGVEMIHRQFLDVLGRIGIETVDESGVPFDPTRHEAVVREDNLEVPSHTVVEVLQKGYFLHERLLRPAMVKVAVGGPERVVSQSGEESPDGGV